MNYKETSASDALNPGEYINKLYDQRQNSQQGLMDQNQKDSNAFLNDQSQAVQNQTNDYVNRTNVEAQKAAQQPTTNNRNLSYGATVQQGLSRQNQQQKDVSALNARQAQAEAEIERQRQQLSQYYQTEIQRATAENDMQRAQQLYNAAKSEDQRLQALRQEAALYAQARGDTSILDDMAAGNTRNPAPSGPTSDEVLRYEDDINKIYDANYQAQQLKLQQERDRKISDLEAQALANRQQTDQSLTDAYTAALIRARNAGETQAAYGMGSGTAANADLSREMNLQGQLTDLRRLQLGKDAAAGMSQYDTLGAYRQALESFNQENELKRAQQLYGSAQDERDNLVNMQKWLGQQLAARGDHSVLDKLYGLTQEQIDRLYPKYTPAAEQPSAASGNYGAGSPGKKRTADAGTKTATKASAGTTDGVLQGTLQLKKGPISPANLADMVAKGEVSVKQNKISNGPYVENTKPFVSAATSGGAIFANPSKKKTTKRTASGGSKR